MKNISIALLFVAMSLVSVNSFADVGEQKAVVDMYNTPIRSILSGGCVITKWTNGVEECGAKAVAQAVPEMEAPVAKTVMVARKRAYIVFFDFDRYNLTESAQEILKNLYKDVNGAKKVSFQLTGHADRSGSDAYNIKLSEKRANTVKNELVRFGASAYNISVDWKGESEPLVPTKDGIKEPQNRRTEIKVSLETEESK